MDYTNHCHQPYTHPVVQSCLLRSESDRGVTYSFILSLEMKDEKQ
ncbi:hypothetical protein [Chroococcidiopsis sp. SAG 2025]|nr:hypothetical protein [Chroococcidiopsis sp. SAG 2025]